LTAGSDYKALRNCIARATMSKKKIIRENKLLVNDNAVLIVNTRWVTKIDA